MCDEGASPIRVAIELGYEHLMNDKVHMQNNHLASLLGAPIMCAQHLL